MSNPVTYIAIIDDDESYSRSLGRLLRAAAYQPVTYPSAEAFLGDANRPRFDCILLDIELGVGISGIELHRRLSAVGSTTPVIYVTAHDDPTTRASAQAAGCNGFVSKVEPSDLLLGAVESVIRPRTN